MQLKEQTFILAIVKHRSITRAADELHVTQPALSMFLSNVEQQLGAKLFDRQEKPMKLTAVGALYVKKANQMMLIKNEFDLEFSKMMTDHAASITFGLQTLRVPHLEPPLQAALQARFPNMHLKIVDSICGDLYRCLQNDEVDFIVANDILSINNLPCHFTSRTIRPDRMVLAVPKQHLVARKYHDMNPKPPVDLRLFQNDLFLLNEANSFTRHFADDMFEHLKWTPPRAETHPRTELNVSFAAQGHGVAFILESYLTYMRNRALDYFPIANSEFIRCDIMLQYKAERFSPDFVDAIQGCVMQAAKSI